MGIFFEACLNLAPQELYPLCTCHVRECGEELVARLTRIAARTTRDESRRDCWEQKISFVHSADPALAMGVHAYGAAGGGAVKNSISVVLLDAQTVEAITVPVMFPSFTFGGIPTMMVLLYPTFPPTIHLR